VWKNVSNSGTSYKFGPAGVKPFEINLRFKVFLENSGIIEKDSVDKAL